MCSKSHLHWQTVICFNLLTLCSAYKILGVFPFPAHSHYALGSTLMKGLADAGHNVTIIAPFSMETPPSRGVWREIVIDGLLDAMKRTVKEQGINAKAHSLTLHEKLFQINDMSFTVTEIILSHPKIQKLLKSDETFDAVIVTEFMIDSIKAFAAHFDAQLVIFANNIGMSWFYKHVGNPTLPSFFPEVFTGYPPRMTFSQRLVNLGMNVAINLNKYVFTNPKQAEYAKRYIPNFRQDINDVMNNVSLVLTYSDHSISPAQVTVPVMVGVGGFHIQSPKKLPDHLQKLMDEANNGVIYFSLGSNMKSEDLPPGVIQAVLKVFSKRKEIILWKIGLDGLSGKPNNVHLGKWFPQQDVLAHPNLKLFITHGGLLSTTETVYHGVPALLIPIMADQNMNARQASNAGYGITLAVETIDEAVFAQALDEVITNPRYRDMAKQRSAIMRDKRQPPLEEAIFWVEYVIRHKGAKHLRVAYVEMSWYQFYLLDVFGFLIAVLLVTLWFLKNIFAFVIRILTSKDKLKKS